MSIFHSLHIILALLGLSLLSTLAHLKPVSSPHLRQRLSIYRHKEQNPNRNKPNPSQLHSPSSEPLKNKPMKPITEILTRLEWDKALPKDNYSIVYRDRYLGLVETSVDFKAADSSFRNIPTHRIINVKYLGSTIWDRLERRDFVFSSTFDEKVDIKDVIVACQEQAKKNRREKSVARKVQQILGDQFSSFKSLSMDYCSGNLTPKEYYEQSVQLIGNAGIFVELVSFLPSEPLRDAVLAHHCKMFQSHLRNRHAYNNFLGE